jgi:MFS family permease
MNGLFQAGAFFGSIGINIVAGRFGRKMPIIVPSLLVLISGACLAGSANVGMFIVFRFFSGMGSWWLLGSVPVWMSEVAPPKNRGVLVDCHSATLLFGYCSAGTLFADMLFFEHSVKGAHVVPSIEITCLPRLVQAIEDQNLVRSCGLDQSFHVGYRISGSKLSWQRP